MRTIYNCSMIKKAVRLGIGECGNENGKCLGYANSGEEPHETCQECKLHVSYEDDIANKVYYFQDPGRDGGLFIAAKTWKEARQISLTGDYDMLAYISFTEIQGYLLKNKEDKPYETELYGQLELYQLDELGIPYTHVS